MSQELATAPWVDGDSVRFECPNCATKYFIAHAKVVGKVLKIRCKTCQGVLVLRGPPHPPVIPEAIVRPLKPTSWDEEAVGSEQTAAHVKEHDNEYEALERDEVGVLRREMEQRLAAEARAEEIERARQREESERKAVQGRLEEAEAARRSTELALARLEEVERGRQREEHERKVAQARLEEAEQARQKEEARRREAEVRAEALEKEFASKKEMRDEIARLRESAGLLRETFETHRRSPMLDDDTQKARRNLVSCAGIALALSFGRLAPSEINIAGIKFAAIVPAAILGGATFVIAYLLIAFFLKAWDAIQVWKGVVNDAAARLGALKSDERLNRLQGQVPEDVALVRGFLENPPQPIGRLTPAAVSDLVMPIVLGLAAIAFCVVARPSTQAGTPGATAATIPCNGTLRGIQPDASQP